jgi:hypothetical protein
MAQVRQWCNSLLGIIHHIDRNHIVKVITRAIKQGRTCVAHCRSLTSATTTTAARNSCSRVGTSTQFGNPTPTTSRGRYRARATVDDTQQTQPQLQVTRARTTLARARVATPTTTAAQYKEGGRREGEAKRMTMMMRWYEKRHYHKTPRRGGEFSQSQRHYRGAVGVFKPALLYRHTLLSRLRALHRLPHVVVARVVLEWLYSASMCVRTLWRLFLNVI